MAGCCASQKARLCGRTRGRHVFCTLTSVDMAATTRFDVIMYVLHKIDVLLLVC